jgi:tetratricopeptide (TPR) repeat protein
VLGPNHSQTLHTVQYLAELHWALGSLEEAEQLARTSAHGFRAQLGPNDKATMEADNVLLNVLMRRGHTDEALGMAEDLLARRSAVLGAVDVDTADTMSTAASLKLLKGDLDAAERLNQGALAVRRAKLGPDHVTTMLSELALADVAVARGNPAAAESICRRAVALIDQRWGPTTKPAYRVRERLGRVLYAENRWPEAKLELETALAGYRRLIRPGHPDILNAAHLLGLTELALGDTGAAEPLLREACDGRRAALGRDHPQTVESCIALASSRTDVVAAAPSGK